VNVVAGTAAGGPPEPRQRPLLEVERLTVTFPRPGAPPVSALREISFTIERGEMVGLVGESGAGKTLTALAVLRLIPPPARLGGRILLDGEDLLTLPEPAMRERRGARIAIVFQDPMTALNPVYTVGFQVAEAVRAHRSVSRRAALDRAAELLAQVALPEPAERLRDYPHQLSGGQQQRVMLAMALAGEPDLLLADEPTTALDVTIQAQILELLGQLRRRLGLTILLITHDLAVVAEGCDRVVVLYAGEVVEEAPTAELFGRPLHPYTRALVATLPRLGSPAPRGQQPALAGQPADLDDLPSGCPFHPRCPERMPICWRRAPSLLAPPDQGEGAPTRRVRCWLHEPLPAGEDRQ
jgi:oligopeptide/dipeptide ABC transporter ATP-binding protein